MISPDSTYDDFPSPDFPTAPRDRDKDARLGRLSEDRDRPPSGGARPRRSQDDHNPPMVARRGDDPSNEPLSDRDPYSLPRRKLSQATTATTRSQQQDLGRRPSVASGTDSTSATNARSATVTSGIIIPNKSTIAEEDIEVPYGHESVPEDGDGEPDRVEDGLGGLARRLAQDPDTDGGARSEDYYDKISFGRASVASDRSARGGRVSAAPNEDGERMRRNYEFRIAMMQSRIASLEREIEDGDVRTRQLELLEQQIKQLEDDLNKFRRVSTVMTIASHRRQNVVCHCDSATSCRFWEHWSGPHPHRRRPKRRESLPWPRSESCWERPLGIYPVARRAVGQKSARDSRWWNEQRWSRGPPCCFPHPQRHNQQCGRQGRILRRRSPGGTRWVQRRPTQAMR